MHTLADVAASRTSTAPVEFTRAVEALRRVRLRPEVTLSEVPAPQRLAPYSLALSGEVVVADADLASGRLVLLHDPAGQEAWEGTSRFVAFVQAAVDPSIGADPLLPAVGWSWLTDALATSGATYAALGGTVTRMTSERFGSLAGQLEQAEVELRASWSPIGTEIGNHLTAFAELMCAAAGLPPPVSGVVAIPPGRRLNARRPRATSRP